MIIKVDKEKLNDISNDLMKSSNSISDEIKLWEDNISNLKNIWQGKDADIFYSRIENYLIKLKMLSETTGSIGKFINSANNKYIAKVKSGKYRNFKIYIYSNQEYDFGTVIQCFDVIEKPDGIRNDKRF